jgi:hypothetical protein
MLSTRAQSRSVSPRGPASSIAALSAFGPGLPVFIEDGTEALFSVKRLDLENDGIQGLIQVNAAVILDRENHGLSDGVDSRTAAMTECAA